MEIAGLLRDGKVEAVLASDPGAAEAFAADELAAALEKMAGES